MSSSNRPPHLATANRLLASLPADDYQRIAPTLDAIPLNRKDILYAPGEPIQHVYFPDAGFCSIVSTLPDGGMVEVATVGREGMIGVEAALSGSPALGTIIVQSGADTCHRMTVDAFGWEMDRHGRFHELLNRYVQALMRVVMQSAVCHATHSVEQRLAHWLLMARYHMEADDIPVTQERIAMMLCVARPSLTVAAGTLQRMGAIMSHRGHVTIVDHAHLEAASCGCYRTSKRVFRNVLIRSRMSGWD